MSVKEAFIVRALYHLTDIVLFMGKVRLNFVSIG